MISVSENFLEVSNCFFFVFFNKIRFVPNKWCLYIHCPLFYKTVGLILLISLSLEMSVPSQGHYGVLSFSVDD
jgi:hypothetical protein